MEFVRVDPPGCDLAAVRGSASLAPVQGTVVFLPGLGGASSSFAQALEAPQLASLDVILIDLLGHGSSDKPANFDYRPASHAAVVFQALRAMKPAQPLHIVGYSMGGAVAVELSRFRPLDIASLILVEPALEAGRMSFASRVAAMSEGDFRARYHEVLEPYGAPEAAAADRHWAETAAFASSSAVYRSAKGLLEAAQRGELWAHFKEAEMPITLVLSPQTVDEWPAAAKAEEWGVQTAVVESPSRAQFFDAPSAFYDAVAAAAFGARPKPK